MAGGSIGAAITGLDQSGVKLMVVPGQRDLEPRLRTHQCIDETLRLRQDNVTTSQIIRLRTEDRLLAVRRIYRCSPTAAVSSDDDAITPVLFILGSHWSMSLARPGSRNRHQEESRQCVLKVLPPQTALHGRTAKCHWSIGRNHLIPCDSNGGLCCHSQLSLEFLVDLSLDAGIDRRNLDAPPD